MTSELGTGDFMLSASTTFGMAWHAYQNRHWELASYYVRRTRGLFRRLRTVKPKYEVQLDEFEAACLEPLLAAAGAGDAAAFEAAFADAVGLANRFHVITGHAYIRWQAPLNAPDSGVDLHPGGKRAIDS